MTTVSMTDLRTKQARANVYLSVFTPVALLSAQINGSPDRGARTFNFDNGTGAGFASITEGQTIVFDTPYGLQRTMVKSVTGTAASGTVNLYESRLVLTDNDPFIIYHMYEPHPIPPAIRSGIFYKFYDLAFPGITSGATPPVAIAGSHRAGFLSAGSIAFSLSASASYAIADGASISSYLWSCLHNGGAATGISFSSTTSATPTMTISEAGQYWLKLIVTDSNGQSSTSYRALFVYSRGVTDPYKDFTIQSFAGDWQSGGWRVSLQATGDVELSEFPDRSLAVLWYENTFNGVSGFTNLWGVSDEILTCGYLRQDSDSDNFDKGTGAVTFQISTIDDLLNNVSELGSVSIGAVSSPTKWYEYASWMTAGRSIHHLLLWHAWGVFQCADVIGLTSNALGVFNTDYAEGSLLQQANGFAYNRGIFAKLICDRLGRLHFVQDSQMLSDAGRAALDTVFTLTSADISGGVDVVREPEETTTFTQLDGFSFDGSTSTPFISIIPGYRENSISYIMPEERGGSTAAVSNQVLADQTDSNVRVGRFHAVQNNNPRELRFSSPYNGLGAFDIIPSIGWYEWGIADADLKRNTELLGRLMVCRHIDARFNHQAGTILTDVVLEPEAIGPPGIQGNYPTSYPASSNNPTDPDWDDTDAAVGIPFGIVWNSDYVLTSGQAIFGELGSILFGVPGDFSSEYVNYVTACGLSDTQVLVVYRINSTSDMTARILDLSGTTITGSGAELTLTTDARFRPAVVKLTTTKALVTWDDGNDVSGVVLTVSGSTLSAGTITLLGLAITGTDYAHACRLSDTLAMAVAQGAVPLAISGTTITPGTAADFSLNFPGDTGQAEVAPLDSTSAVVFYVETGGTFNASLLTSISGSTFTIEDDTQVEGNNHIENTESSRWAMAIDSTRAMAVYTRDVGGIPNIWQVKGAVVTRSGSTLTAGTPVVLASDATYSRRTPTIAMLNSSRAVVAFYAEFSATPPTFKGTALSCNITGSIITDNNDDTDFSDAVDVSASIHNVCAVVVSG